MKLEAGRVAPPGGDYRSDLTMLPVPAPPTSGPSERQLDAEPATRQASIVRNCWLRAGTGSGLDEVSFCWSPSRRQNRVSNRRWTRAGAVAEPTGRLAGWPVGRPVDQ